MTTLNWPAPKPMDWQQVHKYQCGAKKSKTDKRLSAWSKAVKVRDGYKCVVCGCESQLHSHHIKHKSEHPELKYSLDNGATLCAVCHSKEHEGNLAKGLLSFRFAQ